MLFYASISGNIIHLKTANHFSKRILNWLKKWLLNVESIFSFSFLGKPFITAPFSFFFSRSIHCHVGSTRNNWWFKVEILNSKPVSNIAHCRNTILSPCLIAEIWIGWQRIKNEICLIFNSQMTRHDSQPNDIIPSMTAAAAAAASNRYTHFLAFAFYFQIRFLCKYHWNSFPPHLCLFIVWPNKTKANTRTHTGQLSVCASSSSATVFFSPLPLSLALCVRSFCTARATIYASTFALVPIALAVIPC